MKNLLNFIDPYRQSFLFFRWNFWSVFSFVAAVLFCASHAHGFVKPFLENIFVYLPNYLIHEFSHRFWCSAPFWSGLNWHWICYASGNGAETLIPLFLCFFVLRFAGGRYLIPPLLYWLATTLYDAGVYAADARAKTLHLTSSDMMTNSGPGTTGDWHYILEPLGLLEWDVVIGKIFIFSGVFCFVLAVWSFWYYWTHTDQYIDQRRWD